MSQPGGWPPPPQAWAPPQPWPQAVAPQWAPPQWAPPVAPQPAYEQRPIRSHRDPRPGGRLGHRLGVAVLLVVALAAGALLSRYTPDVDSAQRPFIRTGHIGQTVTLPDFTIRVRSVRGAAVLSQSGANHDTGGVWILVTVRLAALHEPVSVGYMALRDAAGHTYRASGRVNQLLIGWRLQPGVPVAGEVAFEVPVAVAANLAVRFARPTQEDFLRMDAVGEVPLSISDSQVRGWKADSTPASPAAPAVTS